MNVSVVMAVRDGERYLAEALASVRAQTVAPLEVLLVDGGSTDATRAIAERHGARVIDQGGDTLADAYNTGIRAARGDAVAFLSHDDLWMPRKLELQLAALADAEACVCHAEFFLDGEPPPGFRPELLDGRGPCGSWRRSPRGARCSTRRAACGPRSRRPTTSTGSRACRTAGTRSRCSRRRCCASACTRARPRTRRRSRPPRSCGCCATRSRGRPAVTVSIIVPVRDGERYLEAALRSLLDQNRPPDELIVVDNGSRDASAAIAAEHGARVLRRRRPGRRPRATPASGRPPAS